MKAAVVQQLGCTPVYDDFADPQAGLGEYRIAVRAAAMSQVVKGRALGLHYSASQIPPFGVGIDGVGRLEDGRRVYFALPRAPFGSMAEFAVVDAAYCVPVPDDVDDVTAAAIANPGQSSWAALVERAGMKVGETVLINGATGTSGRLAVQIARHLGAGKIIATGRNHAALDELGSLGANLTIPLAEDGTVLDRVFMQTFAEGVDIVLDYLWGESAERLLIAAAKAGPEGKPTRYIQIGSISGSDITLPSAVLRASSIQMMGSGVGSIPLDRFIAATGSLLRATASDKLQIASTAVPLSDVERAWPLDDSRRRTVFTIAG